LQAQRGEALARLREGGGIWGRWAHASPRAGEAHALGARGGRAPPLGARPGCGAQPRAPNAWVEKTDLRNQG
jgi:hypothetical protein